MLFIPLSEFVSQVDRSPMKDLAPVNITSKVIPLEVSQLDSAFSPISDLTRWETSSVVNFRNMFYMAISFNGDVSTWELVPQGWLSALLILFSTGTWQVGILPM
mmetsp:Transcript_29635/g.45409  ORF Transcript_29635/g.45409 Transcript_29635/m.45409 type:complete len:104 (+) Transcript_29635:161-472(+)